VSLSRGNRRLRLCRRVKGEILIRELRMGRCEVWEMVNEVMGELAGQGRDIRRGLKLEKMMG
jgi:hypothetical protein